MKVGDYVRTIYGIKKVVDIICGQDIKFDNTDGFDEDLRKYHDYDGISFEGSIWKEIVERTSPNIIDLIEVGDYVNGYQVIEKPYIYHDIQFVSVDTQDSWNWGKGEMPIDEIKSIVTKEQFESMKYKIGD